MNSSSYLRFALSFLGVTRFTGFFHLSTLRRIAVSDHDGGGYDLWHTSSGIGARIWWLWEEEHGQMIDSPIWYFT